MRGARRERSTDALVRYPEAWPQGGVALGRPITAVGLASVLGLGFVALVVALTFGVFVVGSWLSRDARAHDAASVPQLRAGTSLKRESELVDEQRGAVTAYASNLADFKTAMARQADALGLDAAEVRRREAVLAELSLECINQVNQYNLRAQNATPGEIRLVGPAENLSWEVACAPLR